VTSRVDGGQFLARKISRAKWQSGAFADDEIAADAITVDLRTTSNTLSFWTCATPNEAELNQVVLALATTAERLDKFDVAWISEQSVNDAGLATKNTEGKTPVENLRKRHADIVTNNNHRRMARKDVLGLVTEAVRSKLIKVEDLQQNVREEVARALAPASPTAK
jgi:hypothetical protein